MSAKLCNIVLFFALHLVAVYSLEFRVGGKAGWAVPSSKNDQIYNDWAAKNRFKVNDTLRFEYSRDSVMEVTQEEYEKCRSTHPMYFSNNGDSVYTLEQPGLYYFMSAVAGHCERGLKMIVKVLEIQSSPQVSNQTSNASSATSGASVGFVDAGSTQNIFMIFMAFFGAIFM